MNEIRGIRFLPLPEVPQLKEWYRIAPDGAVTSEGSPYHADLSLGLCNRVLFFFHGGGLSWNEYMAVRPKSADLDTRAETFYCKSMESVADAMALSGICDRSKEKNPFRDWTIVSIPYSCADFHCGTADFMYHDRNGEEKILYHHGYINFWLVMEMIRGLLGNPEKIVLAGYSAGGFGAALLAPVIMEMFERCRDFTCIVDSSLIVFDRWPQVVREIWKAPEPIASTVRGNNIIADALETLHERKKNCRLQLLFACSVRDNELSQMVTYIKEGKLAHTRSGTEQFKKDLQETYHRLRDTLPEIVFYIFDAPASHVPAHEQKEYALTRHTLLHSPRAYEITMERKTIMEWIGDAMRGEARDIGLILLQ